MTRVRLERIEIAGDLSHAVLTGTTDGGTVRVKAQCDTALGLALALVATAASPVDIDVPDEAISPDVEEIDRGPAG